MVVSASDDFALSVTRGIQVVFSPIFPFALISSCGVSYVLTMQYHMPQFCFLAFAALWLIHYGQQNAWVKLGLIAFGLAALPMANVAFRECATKTSTVVGHWIGTGLFGLGLLWLSRSWPYDGTNSQLLLCGFLLFGVWFEVCGTAVMTLKLAFAAQPQTGAKKIVESQKAHGDAKIASESEAISLLRK